MSQAKAAIVVGVDGTASGRAALSFAMHEASRRGSALDVVTAWTPGSLARVADVAEGREVDRAQAQGVQDAAVAGALREMPASPTLSRQVVEGDAATVLLALARTADYLVVGAGRAAPGASTSLGSVTTRCVRAAGCPVLVVPLPETTPTTTTTATTRGDNRKAIR